MGCICPLVKEKCIGEKCCEFVPRHSFTDEYGYGIQDYVFDLFCWITKKPYKDRTYTRTISAHCKQGFSSAYRYNKEDWK